ncbi:MAG: hypothetical protein V7754_18250 [Halioglobus sp.]
MELLSEIGNWLFENESAISAMAGLLAICVILFVPLRGLWRRLRRDVQPKGEEVSDATLFAASRPSIIVLPFDDLSEDSSQSAIVDGFTEDLTTLLARMQGYFVFSRSTAFTYRGGADVQAIGRDLDVRYVLEGSIRLMGDKARVTAQLIETERGTHLWAQNFDRPVNQLVDALDELAQTIALQLGGELTRAEAALASRQKPADQSAWELYQQAKSLLMASGWSEQSFSEVSVLARQSMAADPDFAPPRAYLSLILALGHWVNLVPDRQAAHDEAISCAEAALALSPNSSEVLGYVGCAFCDLGYTHRGLPIIEKAIELDPSNAQAFAALGAAKIVTGELDLGIQELEHAIDLSPKDAGYAPWSTLLSFAAAMKGDNDKSLYWARSACQSDPRYFLSQIAYARALAQDGRVDESRAALAEAKRQYPALDKAYIAGFMGDWVNSHLEQAGVRLD